LLGIENNFHPDKWQLIYIRPPRALFGAIFCFGMETQLGNLDLQGWTELQSHITKKGKDE